MTYKICTLNNISDIGLAKLPADQYTISDDAGQPDAILLRSYKMHDMAVPESLLAVGRAGSGVNNIPLDKMSKAGVAVFNAPGANANAVKELVIAGMLMSCRNLMPAYEYASGLEGSDDEIHKQVEAGKKNYGGFELPGRTLGVVGLGAIGVKIANAARALGMNVVGFDPRISIKHAWALSADVKPVDSVDDLLAQSDFITFHVPLLDATRNLINADSIKKMKDNAIILNFARDGIVNDIAVCDALDAGKLYAYICDFPSNQLKKNPRVVTLPHLGASTQEAEINCAVMVAEQIKDYLENGNILNSVNLPDIKLARAGKARIAILNRNTPDMVGQVSHILGKAGANIHHMVNDSKADLAYTLIDIDSMIGEETLSALSHIDGVLKVRLI
ncbi:MAG: phosphoglycerate dehydrogenase [Arenicellales bacterium]